MKFIQTLNSLGDYAGVIVGLALVIVATFVLPGRVRLYVLTAGLAVVAFRVFQIFSSKGRLIEADTKREELRGQLEELRKEKDTVAKDLEELNRELAEQKQRLQQLNEEREAMAESGDALAHEKKRLDQEIENLRQGTAGLLARTESNARALSLFEEGERMYGDLERALAH